jgi:hypothetical protein
MKRTMAASFVGTLTLLTATVALSSELTSTRIQDLKVNVLYRLTPETARQLNINYAQALQSLQWRFADAINFSGLKISAHPKKLIQIYSSE